jgi:predicted nucleotidyltransferase component of viral defense system
MNAHTLSIKLLDYSRKYHVNHQMLLIRFFHERFLYKVSVSAFRDHLLLKGGNLLYATQGNTARPTIDIDFSAQKINNDVEEIKKIFQQIIAINTNDVVVFDIESLTAIEINEQNQYTGVRVKVMAQLGSIKQNIQIDIGFGDVITPEPLTLHYPILFEEFENPIIHASTLETVIAEKLQAIIVLAQLNSRMKDFYDIYVLVTTKKINHEIQKEAITKTFSNRGTVLNFETVVFSEAFYKNAQRNAMWIAFLKKINSEYIPFEKVIQSIEQFLKEIFR